VAATQSRGESLSSNKTGNKGGQRKRHSSCRATQFTQHSAALYEISGPIGLAGGLINTTTHLRPPHKHYPPTHHPLTTCWRGTLKNGCCANGKETET